MQTIRFLTIRQTAQTGVISENRLRALVKTGQIPGVYSGNRFRVNFDLLLEKLDRESRENVREEQA